MAPGIVPLPVPAPIIRSLGAPGLVLGVILAFLAPAAADDAAGIRPLPSVDPGKVSAAARQADVIVEVRIEGNETVEVSRLPKLITRAGQVFDTQSIEEDVRTLHRSRKFVDVHPKYTRVAEGMVVIFQVVERPTLRYVRYVGNNQFNSRTLRKKAEIDVGDAMDRPA